MPTQPASRVEQFAVTIPPGTPQAAPLETLTPWNPGELIGVRIRIPKGHSFLTGMQLLVAHARAIPTTEGSWITGDDDELDTDLLGQLNTGAWSVLGYNTDIYPHTFYVSYFVLDFTHLSPGADEAPIPTPLLA